MNAALDHRESREARDSLARSSGPYEIFRWSIILYFKSKIDGLRFAPGNRHILTLFSVGFMPGCDGVLPRRQVWKFEPPIGSRHGVVRILEHREIAAHPRMNIALHKDEFGLVELFRN